MIPAKWFFKYFLLSGIMGYIPVRSCDYFITNRIGTSSNYLQNIFNTTSKGITDILICSICKSNVRNLFKMVENGKSDEEIVKKVFELCPLASFLIPQHLCRGLIKTYSNEGLYILRRLRKEPKELCNFLLGETCGGNLFAQNNDWKVAFPPVPKPQKSDLPVPKKNAPFLKVLHIADTHYDPYYQVGSNADCIDPLCCRANNGKPANSNATAGKWGDLRKCGTPKQTIESMLNHIVKTHKDIDYIIWTGDLPPHDIWDQTKLSNLQIIKEIVSQMTEKFPDTTIFPAVGNHEIAPMGSFSPPNVANPNVSSAWFYNELDTLWRRWLPESTSKTVRRGAFYSVLLRPGFRIISLNSNFCYEKNLWLLLNSTDPVNQLQWLINELQKSEDSQEKVQIIGHIPPGYTECLSVWSRNFYQIIARYEHTVVGQFYGHTHFDEFQVFYDPKNWQHATGISYIGPSISTYEKLNPGYRIYYVDGDHDETTRLVIDHETWITDLREANLQELDEPVWYKLYSARSAYGMEALRPKDWSEFIEKMSNNRDLFEQYYKHYWKDSPLRPNCDKECRKQLICDCKSGRSADRKHLCDDLEPKTFIGQAIDNGISIVNSVVSFVLDTFFELVN